MRLRRGSEGDDHNRGCAEHRTFHRIALQSKWLSEVYCVDIRSVHRRAILARQYRPEVKGSEHDEAIECAVTRSGNRPGCGTASAQGRGGAAPAANTDIYHVEFVKAAPGQALAAAAELQKQDPKAPMQGHFVVLRHQEGDDWDFCVIEHIGTKATVEIGPPPPASAAPIMTSHNDTFVVGPAWAEFQRVMGTSPSGVYVVSTQRAVPGHRDQLVATLNQVDPASKVKYGHLLFTHLEGGTWQYLSVDHYASWSDFATDRSGAGSGTGLGGCPHALGVAHGHDRGPFEVSGQPRAGAVYFAQIVGCQLH